MTQTNSREIATRQQSETVRALLDKAKPALQQALPRHLNADRLLRIAMTALMRDPKLLNCEARTLLRAVMMSAQVGLEPNTPLQEGYLIPYGREVQFMPSYRGLLKLARQSGEIAGVHARAVYANEEFEYLDGISPVLRHKPIFEGERGEFRLAYAVARFKDPSALPVIEVMNRQEIDAIRARSKASQSGPWVTDYIEMARKTVLRRICKVLPASSELALAVELDNKVAVGEGQSELLDPEIISALNDIPDNTVEPEQAEVPDAAAGDPSTAQPHEKPRAKNQIGRQESLV